MKNQVKNPNPIKSPIDMIKQLTSWCALIFIASQIREWTSS